MTAAADIVDRTRGMASALVTRAERETGSRMTAYARVAAAIGTSASWVRKFVGGHAKSPSLIIGHNISAQYEKLCARIEAAAEAERRRAAELWEMPANEAAQSTLQMGMGVEPTEASRVGDASINEGSAE